MSARIAATNYLFVLRGIIYRLTLTVHHPKRRSDAVRDALHLFHGRMDRLFQHITSLVHVLHCLIDGALDAHHRSARPFCQIFGHLRQTVYLLYQRL